MQTRFSVLQIGMVLVLSGVFVGCQGRGKPPPVEEGAFTAYVQGALSDTITGTAHFRTEDGTIQGFELGRRNGSGLSIELESHPLGLHTYEVVGPELFGVSRPGQSPGTIAFLTLGNGRFAAVNGTLELTYVDDEQVGAEFRFQMDGDFEGAPVKASSVEVTGMLNAPPERE